MKYGLFISLFIITLGCKPENNNDLLPNNCYCYERNSENYEFIKITVNKNKTIEGEYLGILKDKDTSYMKLKGKINTDNSFSFLAKNTRNPLDSVVYEGVVLPEVLRIEHTQVIRDTKGKILKKEKVTDDTKLTRITCKN